jgi:Zn-dependent protease with chaperone function
MLARRIGRRIAVGCLAALTVLTVLPAGLVSAQTKIRPGFNLFTVEQDQEIGRQSAAEAERQLPIITDRTIQTFVDGLGTRLAAVAPGAAYAYEIKVVNASEINAFALPGGYLYLNRGLIEAATSEAQVAGIVAHEMAHVALRHGTNQASKAYLGQSGLSVLGGLVGKDDRSTQKTVDAIGGFGLNAWFMKFSRADERQADIVGAQILAKAGYDPMAMVELFDMLDEAEDHEPSKVEEFFNSHPSPGNRADRVRREMESLRIAPTRPVGGFDGVKSRLLAMSPSARLRLVTTGDGTSTGVGHVMTGDARAINTTIPAPSSRYRTYEQRDGAYRLEYPENWRVHEAVNGYGVTIAPDGGLVDTGRVEPDLIHGVVINHYAPFVGYASDRFGRIQSQTGQGLVSRSGTTFVDGSGSSTDSQQLARATGDLVSQLLRVNPALQVISDAKRATDITGERVLSVVLGGPSAVTRRDERVTLFARELGDEHVIYAVFVSPVQDYEQLRSTFSRMVSSLSVSNDPARHD